jgi:hypothetical protein
MSCSKYEPKPYNLTMMHNQMKDEKNKERNETIGDHIKSFIKENPKLNKKSMEDIVNLIPTGRFGDGTHIYSCKNPNAVIAQGTNNGDSGAGKVRQYFWQQLKEGQHENTLFRDYIKPIKKVDSKKIFNYNNDGSYETLIENDRAIINTQCNDITNHNNTHFMKECCECADTKKGGFINLTKSEAQDLKTQLNGGTNKSTKIIYGGERAKIIGLDKSKNVLIQTNNALHRINTNNIKVNNKYVL